MPHISPGLKFTRGEPENLLFREKVFDVVINFESARFYGKRSTFCREVNQVLKPGGHFLVADMIKKEEVPEMHDRPQQEGFDIESKANISNNLNNGLRKDSHRRVKLIATLLPALLQGANKQLSGTEGSARYVSFVNGKYEY